MKEELENDIRAVLEAHSGGIKMIDLIMELTNNYTKKGKLEQFYNFLPEFLPTLKSMGDIGIQEYVYRSRIKYFAYIKESSL